MSKFSRRQILMAGGFIAAAPFVSRISALAASRKITALPMPPLIEPANGETVTLTMAKGKHSFAPGHSALSAGINANYLGPVVRLKNGSDVNFTIQNRLGETTTLHWHGLFVPSPQDGGPHNIIENAFDWKVATHVNQPSSFNWFHPHLHQNTARQAHMGLAGLMIIDDGKDRERGLPLRYGVDDIALVLQDRRVIDGDHVYAPDAMDLLHGFHGDKLIVNGVINPTARVPAGIVRLRFLNGANARIFHLTFGDRRPFHVIASDGGYLAKTAQTDVLRIAPGERYEALVDFSSGEKDITLYTSALDESGGDKLTLMAFTCTEELQSDIETIPQALDGPGTADPSLAIRRRRFFMDDRMKANMKVMMANSKQGGHGNMHDMMQMPAGGHQHGGRTASEAGKQLTAATSGFEMAVVGKTFDMGRIDVEARKDSYELWELSSVDMMHPFHIHGASFRVVSQDGKPPLAWETGWKDTVLVNRKTEILVHFNRSSERKSPFMFHCHTLEHEDLGMMGQFITV